MLYVLGFLLLGALFHASEGSCLLKDCRNGYCVKTDPRYPEGYCQCQWGYQLSTADKTVCEDRDECKMGDRLVCGGGLCENTMGGYFCRCFRSFVPTFYLTYCESPRLSGRGGGMNMMNMMMIKHMIE